MLIISCTTGVFAFVILKNGVTDADKAIFDDLEKLIRKMIAAFAVPSAFLVSQVLSTATSTTVCSIR